MYILYCVQFNYKTNDIYFNEYDYTIDNDYIFYKPLNSISKYYIGGLKKKSIDTIIYKYNSNRPKNSRNGDYDFALYFSFDIEKAESIINQFKQDKNIEVKKNVYSD